MKKIFLFTIFTSLLISCQNSKKEESQLVKEDSTIIEKEEIVTKISDTIPKNKVSDFIPEGYEIFEEMKGDLNKDGINDCVVIIKSTSKSGYVNTEKGEVNRNRRGIIVLLNENANYKMIIRNSGCFYSENEDGGIYFAPELSVEIKKGNLYINFGHGRYGYTTYTFRLKNSDMELIGYDSSDNSGGTVNRFTSINFLTKKKITQQNTFENEEGENDIFKETIYDVKVSKLAKLSEILDFQEFTVDQ